MEQPKESTGYHYPGANYMGPGTPIIYNIMHDIKPTSLTDNAAMYHDIDYLGDGEQYYSDYKAVKNAELNLQGLAMTLGLTARSIGDFINDRTTLPNMAHFNGRSDLLKVDTDILQSILRSKADKLQYNRATDLNNYKPVNLFSKGHTGFR